MQVPTHAFVFICNPINIVPSSRIVPFFGVCFARVYLTVLAHMNNIQAEVAFSRVISTGRGSLKVRFIHNSDTITISGFVNPGAAFPFKLVDVSENPGKREYVALNHLVLAYHFISLSVLAPRRSPRLWLLRLVASHRRYCWLLRHVCSKQPRCGEFESLGPSLTVVTGGQVTGYGLMGHWAIDRRK